MPEVDEPLIIRRARSTDARAVTRLLLGIYGEDDYFVGDGPAAERNLARRLEVDDPLRSLYLVALGGAGNREARNREGVGGWLELHRAPAWRLEHVAVLTLAVAPEFRRRGLARELLRRSFDWCEVVGVVKMSLHVRAGNSAAISLYEREGFEYEGRERGQIRRRPAGDADAGADAGADAEEFEGGYSDELYEDNLIMGKWL